MTVFRKQERYQYVTFACVAFVLATSSISPTQEKIDTEEAYNVFTSSVDSYYVYLNSDKRMQSTQLLPVDRYIQLEYHLILDSYQRPDALGRDTTHNIELLRMAAYSAQYAAIDLDDGILNDLERDTRELQKRGAATDQIRSQLAKAYAMVRMFDKARGINNSLPAAMRMEIPPIKTEAGFNENNPAVLRWNDREKDFHLINVDIKQFKTVVVGHPLCHFSQTAVDAVNADAALRKALTGSLWIMPQDPALDGAVMEEWNRLHPEEQMVLVYKQAVWTGFDEWSTPTFYFMKDGKVASKVVGWPAEGNRDAICKASARYGKIVCP